MSLSWNSRPRRVRKGFTLIELLVVVLILAVLMAVALPLYLSAVADSQRKTCRANMQTIANAVQAAYVKAMAADYTAYMGDVNTTNEPDLQAVPVCPNGGRYRILKGSSGDNTTFRVRCNYLGPPAHGDFEPGVDGS